ncbi:MAG: DUF4783 domain-containing protein [Bacteroidia bacterium]|nr:DUF4783 domain-containing protein [Bacteroidia bacterium]
MKNTFVKYILGIVIMFSTSVVFADSFDDIINALKGANVKEVSKFFNNTVELTINDNEGVYSKQQAEMMVKNFLANNQPKNIVIQHRGSSGQSAKYAIANYETSQAKFRVYVFMKDSGGGMLVHEMRFEKE